jgi:hypothetical protein
MDRLVVLDLPAGEAAQVVAALRAARPDGLVVVAAAELTGCTPADAVVVTPHPGGPGVRIAPRADAASTAAAVLDVVDEEAAFARSLVAHGQWTVDATAGSTHGPSADGRPVRRRFSAR